MTMGISSVSDVRGKPDCFGSVSSSRASVGHEAVYEKVKMVLCSVEGISETKRELAVAEGDLARGAGKKENMYEGKGDVDLVWIV